VYFTSAVLRPDEQNNNKMQQLAKYDAKYHIPLCNRSHRIILHLMCCNSTSDESPTLDEDKGPFCRFQKENSELSILVDKQGKKVNMKAERFSCCCDIEF
jgi:hypothetical protein